MAFADTMNAADNNRHLSVGQAGRAGRYATQSAGYRAFIPAPLPPRDPPPELTGGLRDKLSAADRALSRLDGTVLTRPNSDLFVFMYVRKEAVLSSQIKDTRSSLQNLLAAEASSSTPTRLVYVRSSGFHSAPPGGLGRKCLCTRRHCGHQYKIRARRATLRGP